MKRCPQCGVLAGDKKAVCRNCQTDLRNEPLLPEPPKQDSVCFPVFTVTFGILAMLLALFLKSGLGLIFTALLSFGLCCLAGMSSLWRVSGEETKKDNGLVILVCAFGILLSLFAATFGGCALMFRFH